MYMKFRLLVSKRFFAMVVNHHHSELFICVFDVRDDVFILHILTTQKVLFAIPSPKSKTCRTKKSCQINTGLHKGFEV